MRTSSAIRLDQLVRDALAFHDKQRPTAGCAWCALFGIPYEGSANPLPGEIENQVVLRLQDVRAEITTLQQLALGTRYEGLLGPPLKLLANMTSISQLGAEWSTVKSNFLRPETVEAWKWAAVHLPEVDDLVSQEAIDGLRKQLDELEKLCAEPTIPAHLREFVRRHVHSIRDALNRYPIRGIEPLRQAVALMQGETSREIDAVAAAVDEGGENGRTLFAKLAGVWRKAATLSGDADKIGKGVAIAYRAYEAGQRLLEKMG